ncbi:hypothetical protein [Dongshaea marina]|nr:hypothetical protein [Dongshaea marina]
MSESAKHEFSLRGMPSDDELETNLCYAIAICRIYQLSQAISLKLAA